MQLPLRRNRFAVLVVAIALVASFAAGRASAGVPRMEAALECLRNARAEIMAASDQKDRHRAKAMEYISLAIEEVEMAIAQAKK